jgi:anti-anti-sigma factor
VSALVVHIRTFPAPTLVTVAGEIDLLTAPQLRERVRPLPDDDVILDISQVRLLAAAGLHALKELQDRRTRAGAQLVLAAPSAPVRRVLCATGLDKTLPVAASVEDAVAFVTAAAVRANSDGTRTGIDGHDPAPPHPPGSTCGAHQPQYGEA